MGEVEQNMATTRGDDGLEQLVASLGITDASEVVHKLRSEQLTAEDLRTCTLEEIRSIGIKLGPAKRLVQSFSSNCSGSNSAATVNSSTATSNSMAVEGAEAEARVTNSMVVEGAEARVTRDTAIDCSTNYKILLVGQFDSGKTSL